MGPTAKTLILELLLAAADSPLLVRAAVEASALFGISENNVRVALVRLSSAGLIEAAERGAYRLARGAEDFAREVATWRTAEARVRAWDGGYVAVHTGALGRSDRTALRRRSRAMQMLGFRELDRGLHLRPDNLTGGVADIRNRLFVLGLERDANVFLSSGFARPVEERARTLWDGKALSNSYKRSRTELERWMKRAFDLDPDIAARESFLLGSGAIKKIVYDPLLPEQFVDTGERHAFFETVRRMDLVGRRIWRRFFEFSGSRRSEANAQIGWH